MAPHELDAPLHPPLVGERTYESGRLSCLDNRGGKSPTDLYDSLFLLLSLTLPVDMQYHCSSEFGWIGKSQHKSGFKTNIVAGTII
ncbi:MAG: hypothetical protein L7F78_15770 [Syntrophales bacterium LBB04]|nr:hypothetical protein [Syntrophales bacterium LBB04]